MQGSVPGPLLFNLYTLPLSQFFEEYNAVYHTYAKDTQIYLALESNNSSPVDPLCLFFEKLMPECLETKQEGCS